LILFNKLLLSSEEPYYRNSAGGEMKKNSLMVILLVIGLAAMAGADTITDTITFSPTGTIEDSNEYLTCGETPVNYLLPYEVSLPFGGSITVGDYVTWQHLFTPPTGTINSATLTLTLYDADNLFCFMGSCFDDNGIAPFGSPEYANIKVEGFPNSIPLNSGLDVDTGDYNVWVDKDFTTDGVLEATLSTTTDSSDFSLIKSVLTIDYTPSSSVPSSVPEPTSLLLLATGLGALGLAVWRKKK